MSGKYLRKRQAGAMQDPTMTHVDDPQAFHVGDCIRDSEGYDRITQIDNSLFGNPDVRFAHLVPLGKGDRPSPGATIHDVRENEKETFRLNTWTGSTS